MKGFKFDSYLVSQPQSMTPDAVAQIQQLIDPRGTRQAKETLLRVHALCKAGHVLAVATAEPAAGGAKRIVGCGTMFVLAGMDGQRAQVEDVRVSPEFMDAERPVERQLLARLEATARQKQLDCVDLPRFHGREAPHELLRELGFATNDTVTYRKPLR